MEDKIISFYEQVKANDELNQYDIDASIDQCNVITLEGKVDLWQHVVDLGHIAGKLGAVKGVINNLELKDKPKVKPNYLKKIEEAKEIGQIAESDIVIIGGGVSGAGIARELSKYNKSIIVVEKASDISEGTTKANNGMIHSGYDSKPGSLKQILCVKGNEMYSKWAEELNFKLNRTGSFVAGFGPEDDEYLDFYYKRALENKVPGSRMITGDEAREIDPAVSHEVVKALWQPTAAYVEPYEVAEALMDNAIVNGAKLMLNTTVVGIETENKAAKEVFTDKGIIRTKTIINAAGLYADDIAEMVDDRFYTIHPRRGALIIFDKKLKEKTNHCFIGTPPKNFTKAGGPTQSPEGNPLWGPSALEVESKEDSGLNANDIDFILEKGMHLVEGISRRDIITFFSGCRAATYIEDFIIEASEKVDNFIHVSGIQSPGLASSPAIAERVENIYLELNPDTTKNKNYNPYRAEVKPFRECSNQEKEELIKKDSKYGTIVCRCETITEAEIVNAVHGNVPATTVDAVKRRTRAGMGRCQGGFCGPRVMEIISRELDIAYKDVTKKGEGSELLLRKSRKEGALCK
jgi:glycerol-3-phosphate dehydrogenase